MQCGRCGEELPAGGRSCPACRRRGEASSPAGSHEKRKPGLRRLFTVHWEGRCPKCRKLFHTGNTACFHDGSPVVVSFTARKWNPFALPVRSAELRCTASCGYRAYQFPCDNRDCNSLIGGPHLSFRFSVLRTFLYHTLRLLFVLALGYLAVRSAMLVLWGLLLPAKVTMDLAIGSILLIITGRLTLMALVFYEWPFRWWFTFEDVTGEYR